MVAKQVAIVGIQPTKNDKYKRYYGLADIAEGKGLGQAAVSFTDTGVYSIGDCVNVVYVTKFDKNGNPFGVWEVLRI